MTGISRAGRIAALFVVSLAIAGAAHAARDTDAVILDTDNSLVIAGGSVSPGKPIPENLLAVGGRVTIDQPVGGNAVSAGGTVSVRAPVGGNARFAGGTVSIDAPVGGNVSAAGGEVRIGKSANIASRARVMAGSAIVDGTINGDLTGSADSFTINGTVNGDVKVAAETLTLGPNARITGRINYASAEELHRADGATVAGVVTRVADASAVSDAAEMAAPTGTGARVVGTVVGYIALLACGAIFLAVAPIFSVEAPDRVRASPGKSIGMGLLTIIGAPVAAVLFVITIIGIPVGVMLLALYPFALLLGFLVATLFVASFLPQILKKPPPPTVAAAIGHFAIALAVVMLVVKVPSVGGLLLALLAIVGVGAFEVELYRRMRSGSRVRA